jgi:DNA-binding CsgD family transcriptional regulator
MREYAQKKLQDADEVEATGERCTAYFVARCQAMALDARFHLLEWLRWTDLEIDNIRAVMRHCLSRGDSLRGIDLVTSLSWFWITRATTEGVRWLDEMLASGPGNPDTLAWTYFIRGFLAVAQGNWVAARPALEKAIHAASNADQPVQLVNALAMASIAEVIAGDPHAAARHLDAAQEAAVGLEDFTSRIAVLQARSLNGIFQGDVAGVTETAAEGVRLSRKVGDLYALHMMLLNLGGAALLAGDLDASKPRYEEALRIAYQVDDRIGQFYLLGALAYHAATSGEARVAAQLLGASDEIRIGAGAQIMVVLAPYLAMAEEAATKVLGPSRFKQELETGRRLTREAAVRLALNEKLAKAEPDGHPGQLGRREADVARLVAEGLSNKQIAGRLFISERTVDSHVRSILNKLGFNSRAQIAAWMASSNSA